MPLIASERHTPMDLVHWREMEALDQCLARSPALTALEDTAIKVLSCFAAEGPLQISVSWGKDSIVLAHLAVRLGLGPLVWYPAGAIENPDCVLVRDAFLAQHPRAQYLEVPAELTSEDWDRIEGHDGAQAEFERLSRATCPRYASGVRAEESGTRKRAMQRFGERTARTCRPIGWWSTPDVFAYLAKHALPVHPAYAMTYGGALDRGRVRVGTIGGVGGSGRGRAQWERTYYPDVVAQNKLRRR